jgi:serine/threonine protein kinase
MSLLNDISDLDDLVILFEKAWKEREQDKFPSLEEYLNRWRGPRADGLRELVLIDIEHRLKARESVRAEDYFRRYPELEGDATTALEIIGTEYERRLHLRDRQATEEEYKRRFRAFEEALSEELPRRRERVLAERRPAPVPGYGIMGELGKGSMGIVYKAWETKLHRMVALKLIRSPEDAEAVKRFKAEASATSQLEHLNVVRFYGIHEHEDGFCLALEYVEGGSLAEFICGRRLKPAQAAALVEVLARAAQFAHDHQIVHRDLKPANVLLAPARTPEGICLDDASGAVAQFHPKITDFGLAKQFGTIADRTQTNAILGTPKYMAPEQAAGRAKDVGPEADVYALGAILYDVLTGRPPIGGEAGEEMLALLERVRVEAPVPPRHLSPVVPRDLETICLKCLEKEPRDRYASALALADDLRCFLDGKPIQARPVGRAARAVKWARRKPWLAASYFVFAVMVLALGVSQWRIWVKDKQLVAAVTKSDKLRTNQFFDSIANFGRGTAREVLATRSNPQNPQQRQAIKDFQESIDRLESLAEPRDDKMAVTLLVLRATLANAEGRHDFVKKSLTEEVVRGAEAAGLEGDAHEAIGDALLGTNDPGKALEHYALAARDKESTRGGWRAHLKTALCCAILGRPGEAVEKYSQFIDAKTESRNEEVQHVVSIVYLARGAVYLELLTDDGRAFTDFDQFVSRLGRAGEMSHDHMYLLLEAKFGRALAGRMLPEHRQQAIEDIKDVFSEAKKRCNSGDQRALEIIAQASDVFADTVDPAISFERCQDADRALRTANVSGDDLLWASVYAGRGKALLMQGKGNEALADFRRAVDLLGWALADLALPVLGASTVGLLGSALGQGPLIVVSALIPGRAADFRRAVDLLGWAKGAVMTELLAWQLAVTRRNIARCLASQRKYAEAITELDMAVSAFTDLCANRTRYIDDLLLTLFYRGLARYGRADQHVKESPEASAALASAKEDLVRVIDGLVPLVTRPGHEIAGLLVDALYLRYRINLRLRQRSAAAADAIRLIEVSGKYLVDKSRDKKLSEAHFFLADWFR